MAARIATVAASRDLEDDRIRQMEARQQQQQQNTVVMFSRFLNPFKTLEKGVLRYLHFFMLQQEQQPFLYPFFFDFLVNFDVEFL